MLKLEKIDGKSVWNILKLRVSEKWAPLCRSSTIASNEESISSSI